MRQPPVKLGQGSYSRDITPEPGLDIVGVILAVIVFFLGFILGAITF